jgi:hypothetical protein
MSLASDGARTPDEDDTGGDGDGDGGDGFVAGVEESGPVGGNANASAQQLDQRTDAGGAGHSDGEQEQTVDEVHAKWCRLVAKQARDHVVWADYQAVLLDPETEAFFAARLADTQAARACLRFLKGGPDDCPVTGKSAGFRCHVLGRLPVRRHSLPAMGILDHAAQFFDGNDDDSDGNGESESVQVPRTAARSLCSVRVLGMCCRHSCACAVAVITLSATFLSHCAIAKYVIRTAPLTTNPSYQAHDNDEACRIPAQYAAAGKSDWWLANDHL